MIEVNNDGVDDGGDKIADNDVDNVGVEEDDDGFDDVDIYEEEQLLLFPETLRQLLVWVPAEMVLCIAAGSFSRWLWLVLPL